MIRALIDLLCRPGLRDLLIRLSGRIAKLEEKVTALTDAITTLTASVDAANDRLTTLLQPLQQALAAAQSELADLKVADDADKAALAAALTDAATATSQILTEVSQIDTFGASPVEPTPPVD